MPMKTSLFALSLMELSEKQQRLPLLMIPVLKALMFQQNLGGQRIHAIKIDVQLSSSVENNSKKWPQQKRKNICSLYVQEGKILSTTKQLKICLKQL